MNNSFSKFIPKMKLLGLVLLAFFMLIWNDFASTYQAPSNDDYNNFPWKEAFDKLHAKFSGEYAFTEWNLFSKIKCNQLLLY